VGFGGGRGGGGVVGLFIWDVSFLGRYSSLPPLLPKAKRGWPAQRDSVFSRHEISNKKNRKNKKEGNCLEGGDSSQGLQMKGKIEVGCTASLTTGDFLRSFKRETLASRFP